MKAKLTKCIYYCICYIVISLGSDVRAQQKMDGRVIDAENGLPLAGVTIRSNSTAQITKSKADGSFVIIASVGDSLFFQHVGYEPLHTRYSQPDMQGAIIFRLIPSVNELESVEVYTGYQQLPAERATGSFGRIDRELIERSVSTDFLGRLENVVPGLQFNRGDAESTDPFLIRGRSTITADAQPLIVLDDFPYEGDLQNINPNHIESVTLLKDAAAASIWGARAANGVIVVRTKRGVGSRPRIEWTMNLGVQDRPDLSTVSTISSRDRVEWEQFLFENGHYASAMQGQTLVSRVNPIPEAVELMIADPSDLKGQLERLKEQDVRNDIKDYLYRTRTTQQYNLNVGGNTDKINYLFSVGYDNNLESLVGSSFQRISLRSSNTYKLTEGLQADVSMLFTRTLEKNGDNRGINTGGSVGLSPYARLVDNDGNSKPYFSDYRKGFIDTISQYGLLDWYNRPIDEISLNTNRSTVNDFLVNTGLTYKVWGGLEVVAKYQFHVANSLMENIHDRESYYARDLVNRFSQINRSTGTITYPVPMGGVADLSNQRSTGHQGRVQLNYQKEFDIGRLVTIAGYEIRTNIKKQQNNLYYGYDAENSLTNSRIDFITRFPQNTSTSTSQIPLSNVGVGKWTDNFLSYYSNFAFELLDRYTLSASVRKDQANLFGVESNMKGTPLWSAGASWLLNREQFFSAAFVNSLKLRATYGVNGNVSRVAAAYTRARLSANGETHSLPTAVIISPPNKNLRWERVKMLNLGVDFAVMNSRLNGSLEFYIKKAVDLLAETPTDPTLGFTNVYANVAEMQGRGWDFQINSYNINKAITWQTNLQYSYYSNTLTKYLMPVSTTGRTYVSSLTAIKPIEGKPLYTALSFPWAGLDPTDGAPRSYLNGEISTDYAAVYNTLSLDDLTYHGAVQPVHYGALRNSFGYKQFGLSFNISYKLGYFFRTSTVINSGLVNGWGGHGDYAKRWQRSGDEANTHVPTMLYPANSTRDNVYRYADIHIHRADNIRLEDVNFSYTLTNQKHKIPFDSMRLFSYISQLGAIWYANGAAVDPYFNNTPRSAMSIALGVNITF